MNSADTSITELLPLSGACCICCCRCSCHGGDRQLMAEGVVTVRDEDEDGLLDGVSGDTAMAESGAGATLGAGVGRTGGAWMRLRELLDGGCFLRRDAAGTAAASSISTASKSNGDASPTSHALASLRRVRMGVSARGTAGGDGGCDTAATQSPALLPLVQMGLTRLLHSGAEMSGAESTRFINTRGMVRGSDAGGWLGASDSCREQSRS